MMMAKGNISVLFQTHRNLTLLQSYQNAIFSHITIFFKVFFQQHMDVSEKTKPLKHWTAIYSLTLM